MWNRTTAALVAIVLASHFTHIAYGQQNPAQVKAAQEAMAKLSFAIGRWKGAGEISMGPGKRSSCDVTEQVSFKAQGCVLMFEGLGKISLPNGKERIVHDALGMISWNAKEEKYQMRTYRPGETLDPTIEVSDNKIVWGFKQPRGKIRFTITVADNKWREIGQFSPDEGKTWYDFFEMNLKKVD